MTENTHVLAFDIGGSSIKTAIVDTSTGQLVSEPHSLVLPQPPNPQNLLTTLAAEMEGIGRPMPIGVGYPGVIVEGVTLSAAHMDKSFIGYNLLDSLHRLTDQPVGLINDADAAGLAEMAFGAGKDLNHPDAATVLMLTLGTGIGSAFFHGGKLFPNTEFGHIELEGGDAEDWAAASVRTREKLDWPQWCERLNRYLTEMEKLVSPVRIILGGGVSENFELFRSYLKSRAEIRVAALGNSAGVIGAALAAREHPAA